MGLVAGQAVGIKLPTGLADIIFQDVIARTVEAFTQRTIRAVRKEF